MANTAQRSFAAGEVSPTLYARTDTAAYAQGLRTLRNATVMRAGGVRSRSGTIYKGATKANGAAILVPAVFSESLNFLLELGAEYVRFWRNGSPLVVSGVSAWVTSTAYTAGVVRSNGGVNYVCILNHTSGASTEPGVGGSWQTAWYALTGTTYEYPMPYLAAELAQVRVVPIASGTLVLLHPNHPPATLTRVADTQWVYDTIDFTETPDIGTPQNVAIDVSAGSGIGWAVTALTVDGTESAVSAFVQSNVVAGGGFGGTEASLAADPVTVSWTAVSGAASYNVYRKAGDDTNYGLLLNTPSTSYTDNGFLLITAYDIVTPGTVPVGGGVFGSAGEYPGAGGFYQQRLILGGTTNNPDTLWASRSASPFDFTISDPLIDADSLSWRHLSAEAITVRHLLAIAGRLIGFNDTAEMFITGDVDGILRPGEVNPRTVSYVGASELPPLPAEDNALFVQARGQQVFDIRRDGTGSELSVTANHLLDGYEVVAWCYQQMPDRIVWAVRDDGSLLSLTYMPNENVLGWARHDTDGVFESVARVREGTEDAVYVVVRRTINGDTVRYVERMANRLADDPVVGMDAVIEVTV